jgi:hypothetical protein
MARTNHEPTAAHSHDSHARPLHRLSLIKGPHAWRFQWEDGCEAALIGHVADLARDDAFDFDWFDAAVVCKHVARPARRTPGTPGNPEIPGPDAPQAAREN